MILILSEISDQHADRVETILRKNSAEYSRLNLDIDSVKNIHVSFENNSFRIEAPNCSFATSQIETVWNRSTLVEEFIENSNNQHCRKPEHRRKPKHRRKYFFQIQSIRLNPQLLQTGSF